MTTAQRNHIVEIARERGLLRIEVESILSEDMEIHIVRPDYFFSPVEPDKKDARTPWECRRIADKTEPLPQGLFSDDGSGGVVQ